MNITRRELLATTAGAAVATTATASVALATTTNKTADPIFAVIARHDAARRLYDAQAKLCDQLAAQVPPALLESPSVCVGHYWPVPGDESDRVPVLAYCEADLIKRRDREMRYISPATRKTRSAEYESLIAELKEKKAQRDADPRYAAYARASEKADKLCDALIDCQVEVSTTAATTIEGTTAKARVLKAMALKDSDHDMPLTGNYMTASLASDLERLAGVTA